MKEKIIAIDQGTSSTRAVLYDAKGRLLDAAQEEFEQFFPIHFLCQKRLDPSNVQWKWAATKSPLGILHFHSTAAQQRGSNNTAH